jgi:hypothetical protein
MTRRGSAGARLVGMGLKVKVGSVETIGKMVDSSTKIERDEVRFVVGTAQD